MGIFSRGGQESECPSELAELKEAVLNARMPAPVTTIALKEIEKLEKTSSSATEYTIGINYVEYLASLPWNKATEDDLDIEKALNVLNREHFGLVDIKERLLEHLAVRTLRLSRKFRILVVDDEQITRTNLSHVLVKDGYQVTIAASGMEALQLFEKTSFDVVVTDFKMEKVSGMEVLEKAKTRAPNTEVIMITGYATTPTAVEAMKKGSYHFLAKPLQLDQLRTTIREALAGKQLQLQARGPVLCFVGPPGTGKTSLGRTIACSLQRKFIHISMAGLKDEAEIRGHRRSYVGALPGRIIQEIRRVESKNPVIMLDEIDKIGQDFKGDPASALLEVLDHEQNANFLDHYLDVPFDLSSVMFITTANTIGPIPAPLLDRLELLRFSGYTEEEKLAIAVHHLIPREIEEAGLADFSPTFTLEAIQKIIREYTREAGLRNLQRQMAAICRENAREVVRNHEARTTALITPEAVERYLGPRKYYFEVSAGPEKIGVVTGLAWTETGGEIIFIEAIKMKGSGRLILTGSLGEVMKESAQAALSYLRSNPGLFDIPVDAFDDKDIHIHVPAGAIPKDGPSAGLTIAMALISLLTGRPCRRDTALTGELTLTGRILPVGGVREKILSAHRAGLTTVIFPARNEADLRDLPEEIKKNMKIVTTDEVAEIIDLVLRPGPGR